MRVYLENIVRQLHSFSLSLNKTSIFIDRPWALIDEEYELQKLIFKGNKELILSKNGQVTIGKWDYFPEANSLLIDRGVDKILCREGYIDKGVMILKLDGTRGRYFILANENVIPNLDAIGYLNLKKQELFDTHNVELDDGRFIQIIVKAGSSFDFSSNFLTGQGVSWNSVLIPNGFYKLKNKNLAVHIFEEKIARVYNRKNYKDENNNLIIVYHKHLSSISLGDIVFDCNEVRLNSTKVNIGKFILTLSNGEVIGWESTNKIIIFLMRVFYFLNGIKS